MSSHRSTAPPTRPAAAEPTRRSPAQAVAAAAAVAVLAVVAVVVVSVSGGDEPASRSAAPGPAGMAHVHGLGVDPGDGQLYAGTHYGLFRVPEQGDAQPIAGRVQDFMGFTVVGAGHYLASGHPGAGQDGPGNLGLIESTDGGQSWQTLSLEGVADFHALEARHGRVYGWNAGRLLVSEDAQTWDERASIDLADFAVSPDDPDTLLATTPEGLATSTDGGRTFRAVSDAPLLQLVTWTGSGTVVGVDPGGGVHVSRDGGASWDERGAVGAPPAALTATDEQVYVATVDGTISVSADGGATFDVRYREQPPAR